MKPHTENRTLHFSFFLSLLLSFFTSLLLLPAFSQETTDTISYRDSIGNLKTFQVVNMAKNAERVGDIYKAAEYYELLVKLKPSRNDLAFKLAELYRRARDYEKAKEQYLKVYEKDPIGYPEALFYHAMMQKATGDYEGSTATLQKYKKEAGKDKKDDFFKKQMKAEMLGNEIAQNLIDTPAKAVVTHLGASVNKAHIEFSPVPVDEKTLIYASLRTDTLFYYSALDTTIPIQYKKFYSAKKVNDTTWKFQGELEGPFNVPDANTGNGAFSPDGKRFYFTRCNKNFSGKMLCAIYVSANENGNWSEPEKLPDEINSDDYTTTQPAIGSDSRKDQEVLYFVSDRKGSKGGLDIWFSAYDAKKQLWTPAKNAGKINTVSDEMTPFYDNDTRTLYFSSGGHPGMGGLDIFKVTGELNKFSEPENMRSPLNSSADDLYYTVAKNKEEGYWTSNREGGVALKNPTCCDDIYHFKLTNYLHVAVKGKIFELPLDTAGKFTSDTVLLNGATVSLSLLDKSGQSVFISQLTMDETAKYFFKLEHGNTYKIAASKEGYFSKEVAVPTAYLVKSDTIIKDIQLEKIPHKPITIKNIYFDFDKWDVTEASRKSLDTTLLKLLNENKQLIVEIGTHTDSKGTDQYNVTLSQKRAESVVSYLIAQGIDKTRLQAKGYGETQPIAPNENSDGSDNPDGRAKNRRTEFRVVGTVAGYSGVNYEE